VKDMKKIKLRKKVKLCKVRLNYSVEYYVAANDNKEETAISAAERNVTFKMKQTLGDIIEFNDAEIVSAKEVDYSFERDSNEAETESELVYAMAE
jgi:hypothetical protein